MISLNTNSVFLFGKDDRIADVLLMNPTCSSQHAVIQFREVGIEKRDGTYTTAVRPYLMDLESTNGTLLNGVKVEGKRYYELLEKDVVVFGLSQRQYVVMKDANTVYTREMFSRGE